MFIRGNREFQVLVEYSSHGLCIIPARVSHRQLVLAQLCLAQLSFALLSFAQLSLLSLALLSLALLSLALLCLAQLCLGFALLCLALLCLAQLCCAQLCFAQLSSAQLSLALLSFALLSLALLSFALFSIGILCVLRGSTAYFTYQPDPTRKCYIFITSNAKFQEILKGKNANAVKYVFFFNQQHFSSKFNFEKVIVSKPYLQKDT